MESLVDKEAAKAAGNTIDKLAKDADTGAVQHLSAIASTPDWRDGLVVTQVDGPKTWRFLKAKSNGDAADEEMVFALYGVLLDKNLPPITTKPRSAPGRYKFLRQSATLEGAGAPAFEGARTSIQLIHKLFDRSFEENKLEAVGDSETIGASNRYLTPKRDALNAQHVGFDKLVDPKGILEEMAGEGEGFVHTEDNAVSYWQRKTDTDGNQSYVAIGPQAFRLGNVVEAQISIVTIPMKDDKFKMLNVLRALTLVEERPMQAQSERTAGAVSQPSVTLKRKVGYGEDREKGKRVNMEVDG